MRNYSGLYGVGPPTDGATMPPWRRHLLLSLVAMAGALALSSGCFTTKGPALPELKPQRNQTTQRTERLRRIRQVMVEDLEEFEQSRKQFSRAEVALYAPPFPLDLYKHVAMECLNEPWDANALEVSDSDTAARRAGLACSPQFLDELLARLEEHVPGHARAALDKLRTLDRMRRLRGQLRQRLSRIPVILGHMRSYLAGERADLRQLRLSYRRRRTEFSAARWQRLQSRLDDYEQMLDALDAAIDQLADAWPEWPGRLDDSVRLLYMGLSKLTYRGSRPP